MNFSRGLSVLLLLASSSVWANNPSPACLDNNGQAIPIINQQVLYWKTNTPNQTLERAHVAGPVGRVFQDRNGHMHFAIHLANAPMVEGCQPSDQTDCRDSSDLLEVVYNIEFGPTPTPVVGMPVEACGDYITSTAQAGPYPPSPAGAIIHWIHMNPSGGHPSGYLIMAGDLCGQDIPPNESNGNENETQFRRGSGF